MAKVTKNIDTANTLKSDKNSVENFAKSKVHNNTNICVTEAFFAKENTVLEDKKKSKNFQNNKFSSKISYKSRQSYEIKKQIANFFQNNPCVIDKETGELQTYDVRKKSHKILKEVFAGSEYEQLYSYYNRLGLNESVYAGYENEKGEIKTQIVATNYSMHRMDPVWAFRRNQIIRHRYNTYFEANRNILNDYIPVHCVLTFKHDSEGFFLPQKEVNKHTKKNLTPIGQNDIEHCVSSVSEVNKQTNLLLLKKIPKRFFGRELIAEFKKLRDNNRGLFNTYFVGGTYNMEVKKSKDFGIHCHLHILFFQKKEYDINEVGDWLKSTWCSQCGCNMKGQHYEMLYYKEKSEETQKVQKHHYDSSWSVEQVSRSIMECLKYNFKPDTFNLEKNVYDIVFLNEVLHNSENLRFTSRFGIFYNEKLLNFNVLKCDDIAPIEEEEKEENEFDGVNVDKSFENLTNPFTGEKEKPKYLFLSIPKNIWHNPKNHEQEYLPTFKKHLFSEISPNHDIKFIMLCLCKKNVRALLEDKEHKKFTQQVRKFHIF